MKFSDEYQSNKTTTNSDKKFRLETQISGHWNSDKHIPEFQSKNNNKKQQQQTPIL